MEFISKALILFFISALDDKCFFFSTFVTLHGPYWRDGKFAVYDQLAIKSHSSDTFAISAFDDNPSFFFLLLSPYMDQTDEMGNLLCMINWPSRVHLGIFFASLGSFLASTLLILFFFFFFFFRFPHYVNCGFFLLFVTLGEPKWQDQKSAVYDQLVIMGAF